MTRSTTASTSVVTLAGAVLCEVKTRLVGATLVLAALSGLPAAAGAQSVVSPTPPSSRDTRVPWLMVGVAAGTAWGESGPATLLSVQVPIGRFVMIESETTYRMPGRWQRRTLTTGANVLFRAGTPRVLGFVGGGVGVQRTTAGSRYFPYLQVNGGIDVPLTRQVIGFGAVRAGSAPEDGIRAVGGVRVKVGTRVLRRSAEGKQVRVTAVDGPRGTGKLVSLSDSAVVFRRNGQDISLALRDVRKVEKVSHGVRNGAVIGIVPGSLWGYLLGEGQGEGILIVGAIGAGIGAGIGAIVNAARANGNLLYQAPGPPNSVTVAPILSPRRQGVALAMRW